MLILVSSDSMLTFRHPSLPRYPRSEGPFTNDVSSEGGGGGGSVKN